MIQNLLQVQRVLRLILTHAICSIMRFRVAFGLFGWSENSSFPSALRARFAFAHSSPYRKSNRNDKEVIAPHPSPPRVGEGIKAPFAIRPIMRFRVAFGLFGWSENSSFPSTLRARFAIAHASPYRKSNRNDKVVIAPHPSPPRVGEGIPFAIRSTMRH